MTFDLSLRLIRLIGDELGLDPGTLGPATRLAEIADSLDWMNLLTAIEAEFKLRIDTADALSLATIDELVDFVGAITLTEPDHVPA